MIFAFHIKFIRLNRAMQAEPDAHRVQVVKGILEFFTGMQRHPTAQGKACSRYSSQLTQLAASIGLEWDWSGHFSRLAHKKLVCVRGTDRYSQWESQLFWQSCSSHPPLKLGTCGEELDFLEFAPFPHQSAKLLENPGANSIFWAGIFILLLCILTSFVIPSSPQKNVSCCKVCRELILFSFTHSMYTLCKLNDLHTQISKQQTSFKQGNCANACFPFEDLSVKD